MRSSWKGFYTSSNIFFTIIESRMIIRSSFFAEKTLKERKKFIREALTLPHWTPGLRNSTIVRQMSRFKFFVYNGVRGHVTSKVRKKGKEMNKFKSLKFVRCSRSMVGHKVGEFTLNRNFLKHTVKKKNK